MTSKQSKKKFLPTPTKSDQKQGHIDWFHWPTWKTLADGGIGGKHQAV